MNHPTIVDVSQPEHFSPQTATFVRRAREFCSFIEDAPRLSLRMRMVSARQHLLELYSAAVDLPSVELPEGTEEPAFPATPDGWTDFEAFENYWEVFDPYVIEKPLAGSLSDDLLDVFGDVRRGLELWDRDEPAGAIWSWRFSFETHWGDHAVDALRALHRACSSADTDV